MDRYKHIHIKLFKSKFYVVLFNNDILLHKSLLGFITVPLHNKTSFENSTLDIIIITSSKLTNSVSSFTRKQEVGGDTDE